MDEQILIDNIKLSLNIIENAIQNNVLLKTAYHQCLGDMNEAIFALVESVQYDRDSKEDCVSLFKENTDERLKKAEERLKSTDSYTVIPFTVQWIYDVINKWWDDLGFNLIKNILHHLVFYLHMT